MGWVSTIEDVDKRLNDNLHRHEIDVGRQNADSKQLHEECDKILAEIKLIWLKISSEGGEKAADMAQQLHREQRRKENLSKALEQNQRLHHEAERKLLEAQQRYSKAEKLIASLDADAIKILKQQNRNLILALEEKKRENSTLRTALNKKGRRLAKKGKRRTSAKVQQNTAKNQNRTASVQ